MTYGQFPELPNREFVDVEQGTELREIANIEAVEQGIRHHIDRRTRPNWRQTPHLPTDRDGDLGAIRPVPRPRASVSCHVKV
jgi:hypothetical protein